MRVGIVTKRQLTAASSTLAELEEWLRARDVPALWAPETAELMADGDRPVAERWQLAEAVDLVLVLGGDGTLLSMAGIIGTRGLDVPILGVNFGSLGFLTEITHAELFSSLEAALAGRVDHDARMMLFGSLPGHTGLAMNDIVLARTALSRMVDLDVTVGDQFVTSVRSDGLIIATPTGSTAYNLSAGGPVVHPAMDAMVLTPIAPHTLTHRPIVIPAAREVRVRAASTNAGAEIYVTFDGQHGLPLAEGGELSVTRAAKPIRLVRAANRNYFAVLREKLKWGER
ncbi:MAG: NAD(+)/NADH kinase [Acidobacteriota bacterium]